MLVNLLGVLEDGNSNRGVLVPENPRTLLRIPQDSDTTLRIRILTSSGPAVDLTTGTPVLVFTVKQKFSDLPPLIQKTATITPLNGPGVAEFLLTPADTRSLVSGRYLFDVVLTQSGLHSYVMPTSPLVLERAVNLG